MHKSNLSTVPQESNSEEGFALFGLFSLACRIFFPQMCKICGREVEKLFFGTACSHCWKKVSFFPDDKPRCTKCLGIIQNARQDLFYSDFDRSDLSCSTFANSLDTKFANGFETENQSDITAQQSGDKTSRRKARPDTKPATSAKQKDNPLQPVSCPDCKGLHFDRVYSLGIYQAALRQVIIDLKEKPHFPTYLNRLIIKKFDCFNEEIDLIVPVPLSRKRRHERGFNQSEIIAKAVSRACKIPLDTYSLARIKHAKIQRFGMDKLARQRTVSSAFVAARPKIIRGKNILLVDD
ncbi:MAG TPA: hypothetical protein VNK26_06700, partial [Pyrinomonadaceae bacterium]|nr:hypothetical protein [Pyrinomonadaceae bacterium]